MATLQKGVAAIKAAVQTFPKSPGVYRMLDKNGEVLYVGKAKSLHARVTSYTRPAQLGNRLQRMISLTDHMEVITTHTEAEALLLESNLIKKLMPPYNILLRDDKSYPYIMLTGDHAYPRIKAHRGPQKKENSYFGPYASKGAVDSTIADLQRAFLIRNCTDNTFKNRARPCLQYHIKRCAAPCVNFIDPASYGQLVADAKEFLHGKSDKVQKDLSQQMAAASDRQDYEQAATYRNRIRALTAIQSKQSMENLKGLEEADIIAIAALDGQTCIQVFFIRHSRILGNTAHFPRHHKTDEMGSILSAFVGQFYADKFIPKTIVLSEKVKESTLLAEALSARKEQKVRLMTPQRGAVKKVVVHALKNAHDALTRKQAHSQSQQKNLQGVADLFSLPALPRRIEIYDNSHISGTNAVGAMVVATAEGFDKKAYRTFNIKSPDITPGDDYGMMREVLTRRFRRALEEDTILPDLILIDGGRGQLSIAMEVLNNAGVDIPLVGVAKGADRHAGRERFYLPSGESMQLPKDDPILYYIQRLRDEAHRFAIGTHRQKRKKSQTTSVLDDIAGVGAKRKKALLLHFGAPKGISQAGIEDLCAVEGISRSLAENIYNYFHHG